jgi:hypothetical protein
MTSNPYVPGEVAFPFFFTSQMSKRNESKKPQIKEQADKTMKDTNIIF